MHARSCINSECIRKEPIQKAAALLPSASGEYEGVLKSCTLSAASPPTALPLLHLHRCRRLWPECSTSGRPTSARAGAHAGSPSAAPSSPTARSAAAPGPFGPHCLCASRGQPIDPLLICFNVFFSRSHRNLQNSLTRRARCSSLQCML
jgi:hypothetical protein